MGGNADMEKNGDDAQAKLKGHVNGCTVLGSSAAAGSEHVW